ncbi:MAG: hypothetical protein PF568_00090, partial [Deltaproteobacteria bacterium]|nr:hypothetical protein [Deltaproteobacteria bacterium]
MTPNADDKWLILQTVHHKTAGLLCQRGNTLAGPFKIAENPQLLALTEKIEPGKFASFLTAARRYCFFLQNNKSPHLPTRH